ncbi:hypothetical protein HO173_012889 [Letharia columbiana]|uniref:Uncharacterized protein n=1 Tax=Letharia columbiana TaxID=112416 RepID=A0A8H6CJK3_9LECA|nr:uncharacterized protein HO173_012889 [Letharia columbiana]KAF6224699.1 hypothetical protein HO173_012889 [Letharia columbiana]
MSLGGIWSSKLGAHVSHCLLATGELPERAVILGVILSTSVHSHGYRAEEFGEPLALPVPAELFVDTNVSYAYVVNPQQTLYHYNYHPFMS